MKCCQDARDSNEAQVGVYRYGGGKGRAVAPIGALIAVTRAVRQLIITLRIALLSRFAPEAG